MNCHFAVKIRENSMVVFQTLNFLRNSRFFCMLSVILLALVMAIDGAVMKEVSRKKIKLEN